MQHFDPPMMAQTKNISLFIMEWTRFSNCLNKTGEEWSKEKAESTYANNRFCNLLSFHSKITHQTATAWCLRWNFNKKKIVQSAGADHQVDGGKYCWLLLCLDILSLWVNGYFSKVAHLLEVMLIFFLSFRFQVWRFKSRWLQWLLLINNMITWLDRCADSQLLFIQFLISREKKSYTNRLQILQCMWCGILPLILSDHQFFTSWNYNEPYVLERVNDDNMVFNLYSTICDVCTEIKTNAKMKLFTSNSKFNDTISAQQGVTKVWVLLPEWGVKAKNRMFRKWH